MKSFLKTMIVIMGIVTVLAVAAILLVISNTITLDNVNSLMNYISRHGIVFGTVVAFLSVIGVLAIVSIACSGNLTNDIKGGIILPLKVGEVHISSQTFESIVENVAKKYAGIKTAKVNIKIRETGLSVDLFAYVLQDTVISDITEKIQADIKTAVLKQTTVAVETVNIKIKGVYTLGETKEA